MNGILVNFERNIKKENTRDLLLLYGGLYYGYFEYGEDIDEKKMDLVMDEILKRTGELKND